MPISRQDKRKRYYAFISYSHKDSEWAKWLQHELEYYQLPATLNGREGLPTSFRPIFRDEDELSGGELKPQISKALADSEFLIVICSPNSAQSKYVNSEIKEFIEIGKTRNEDYTKRIFPLIVEGKPHQEKSSPIECFPEILNALKDLSGNEIELIAGNVNATNRDHAFVQILAGTLREKNVQFSELWDRYAEAKVKEEERKRAERDKLYIMQSKYLAEKSIDLTNHNNSYLARKLALYSLPSSLNSPEKPAIGGSEKALRYAVRHENCEFKFDSLSENIEYDHDDDNIAYVGDYIINLHNAKCSVNHHLRQSIQPQTEYRIDRLIVSTSGDTCYFSCFESALVICYDLRNSTIINRFPVSNVRKNTLLIDSVNNRLIYTSIEEIRIWDLLNNIEIFSTTANGWGHTFVDNIHNRLLWYERGGIMSIDLINPSNPQKILIDCPACDSFILSDDQKYICVKSHNESVLYIWDNETSEYLTSLEITTDILNLTMNSNFVIVIHQDEFVDDGATNWISIYDICTSSYIYQRKFRGQIVSYSFNPTSGWLTMVLKNPESKCVFENINHKAFYILSKTLLKSKEKSKYSVLDFLISSDIIYRLEQYGLVKDTLDSKLTPIVTANPDQFFKISRIGDNGRIMLSKSGILIQKKDKMYSLPCSSSDISTHAINVTGSHFIELYGGKFIIYNVENRTYQDYAFDQYKVLELEDLEFFCATRVIFIENSTCIFLHKKGFSVWDFDDVKLSKNPSFQKYGNGISVQNPDWIVNHEVLFSQILNELYFISNDCMKVLDLNNNKISTNKGINLKSIGRILYSELSNNQEYILCAARNDGILRGNAACNIFVLIDIHKWSIVDYVDPDIEFTACHFGNNCESVLFSDINGNIQSYEFLPLSKLMKREQDRFKDVPLTLDEKRKYFIEQ